jgi:2-polyprenyl-3-methyl-5-hydroxy-6-metoxy-1,4-benzoquinol methylase
MRKYCDICHANVNKFHKWNRYQRCSSCGTFYVVGNPKRKTILQNLNSWAQEVVKSDTNILVPSETIYQRVNTLTRTNFVGKKLLDVGCGIPDFLLAAKKSGFRVSGMDVAGPIIGLLIKYKIPAYTSFKDMRKQMFDVVTNFDVIEHTTNPIVFIQDICRVTKRNGVLLLSTPNAASLSAKVLGESWWVFGPDGHYVLFTPKSIRILLEKNGYSVVNMKTNTLTQWIHTRFKLLNRIGNKIIYCVLFPFLPILYRYNFGDNIEVLAKKVSL